MYLALLLPSQVLVAQTMPNFLPFTQTKLYPWEDPYESYQYQSPKVPGTYNLRFRLKKPNGWVATPSSDKYPLILFFHGSGESSGGDANVQDNAKQLLHGGQTHLNAVNNGTFPGFLLYPQMRRTGTLCGTVNPNTGLIDYSTAYCPNNNWGPEWREAVRYVVDKLIADYKVDPDRIYIHGLSGGGEATWQFITDYPEYAAAAHPMSAAGDEFHESTNSGYKEYYKHIPLWSSQGALDTNPYPAQGNAQITTIRDIGGSIRYSYYPSLGHGTWNSEYAQPDFFSWFLARKKNQIMVYYEQPLTCPGDPVNVKLGFTKTIYPNGRGNTLGTGDYGFGAVGNKQTIINYEWAKGNTSTVVASGATLNEITITTAGGTNALCTPGTYYGRFQRLDGVWTDWSDPVLVDNSRGPSPSPTISSNGKSTTLPSLDGGTEVLLTGTAAKAVYQWKKDATDISAATSVGYTVSQPGTYTLISKDAAASPYQFDVVPTVYRSASQGCFSLPSNAIPVTTSNGIDVPAPPGNFFVSSNSQNSVIVTWDDRSNNETGFEIYRSLASGSGYSLVTIIPASVSPNPQTYTDNNLLPNTTYFYRMRAVNASGGSAYTQVASATTIVDNVAPTSPVLTVGGTLRSTVLLQWSGATDNVGITGYDIYQNGSPIATVNGTTLFYEAKNLVALSVYNYYVKAKDLTGNTSPPSNQVAATARNSGLLYKYYHHPGLMASTVDIPNAGTLNKIGFISTVSTSPRTQTDNYAFVYEGFINLPSSGNYRFSTQSDEGSQMWINNTLVVANDGKHTSTKVNSAIINLSAGWYPIRVEYFENTGTETLTAYWTRPGSSEQAIPSSAFTETVANPPSVSNPSNFRSTLVAYNQVALAWNDNSNNETGFEIYRLKSADGTGIYQVVNVTVANTTTWTDNTVEAATSRYYYRIRAINASNASSLINLNSPGYVITPAAPSPPAVPASLTATAISATQVNLSWGNVSGETGFELQKSSNSTTGFATIANTTTDVTTYSDNAATGHSTFYYRVRSKGVSGTTSNWSNVASATTPNRNPVITDIPDQSLLQLSATPQTINLSVSDPDNDPISFQFTGLPNTYTFNSNGYGQGVLSFTNVAAGTYNVTVQASDGIGTTNDNLILTVGTNRAPIISALTIDGVAVLPAPITTVQNQAMEAGRVFTMVFTLTDPDNNNQLTAAFPPVITLPPSLTFAGNPAPAWNATLRTYTVVFKPTIAQTGTFDNITIQFKDNVGGINQQTFSLIVNPADTYYTINVNFTGDPSTAAPYHEGNYYETAPWNNTGLPPTGTGGTFYDVLTNMKDDMGSIVKYIKMRATPTTGGWTGPPNNSDYSSGSPQFPTDPNAVFTSKVRRSFWKVSSGGGNGQYGEIKFTNLNPSLKYKVTLFGAYPTGSGITVYTVTGISAEALADLPTLNNTHDVRVSTENYPSAAGELTIRVKGKVANTTAYINGLVLEAKYLENAPPSAPSEVALDAPLYNKVNVTWQDNSPNESEFRIYRATVAAGPYTQVGTVAANIRTFSDVSTTGRVTYYYKVSAYNAFGESALSNYALITTPNGVPVLTNPGTVVLTAGQIVQTNILAVDPENDPMVFSVSGLPSFATIVDNGNGTGFIRFAPTASDVGPYLLSLKVVDNFSASADTQFSVFVSDPEVTESVYVNFTASASSNATPPWNNVSSSAIFPLQLSNGIGQLGGVSGTLSIAKSAANTWGTALDNVGVNTGGNAGVYPDKVIQSGWTTVSTSTAATITISGLATSGRVYNITLLGSRDEFWFANTIYQVTTPSVPAKTLNTRKNVDKVVRFTGIAPNGSGVIVISVKKDITIENPSGGAYTAVTHREGVVNGMVLEGYAPATLRRPSKVVATALTKSSIRLAWVDNSSTETGFEIQRALDPAGPFTTVFTAAANAVTWDNTGLNPNTAYVYQVRAIKTTAPAVQSSYSDIALTSTYNQIIQVNVNSTLADGHPQETSGLWNNLSALASDIKGVDGFTWENFKDNTSSITPVDFHVIYYGNGGQRVRGYAPPMAGVPANQSPIGYPDPVIATGDLFLPGDPQSQWQLQHLDPNLSYDLVFFSSEWEIGRQFNTATQDANKIVTDFTIGASKQSLFNNKNNSERIFFYNVKPEADSTLNFNISANNSTTETIYNGMWSAFEVRSYTSVEATFDMIPPTVPQNLVASNIATDSLRLTWSASSDNIKVAGYEIFRGTDLVATVAGTTALITDLQPSTTYTFSVRAKDLKGNVSALSNAIQVTTLSATGSVFYYPAPTGDITLTSTWGNVQGGGGSHPPQFNFKNQHFILDRDASVSNLLDITGTNTKLIVSSGVVLTLDNTVTGQIDVDDNGTLIINSYNSPQLGTLAPTSTVTFNGTSNSIPGASYGNLVMDGTTSTKTFSTGTYIVNGDLTLADGVMLNGSGGNGTAINLSGDLTLEGALTPTVETQLVSINFASGSTQNLIMNAPVDLQLFQLRLSNKTIVNTIGNSNTKTITVGSTSGGGLILDDTTLLTLGKSGLIIEGAGAVNANNELGQLSVSKADITINSTGAQFSNLYFKSGADTLNALHMSANALGQVNIGTTMYVKDIVDVASGRLNSAGNIVLVSDINGTAMVGKIGANGAGSINGSVRFQRYMSAKRVYRYMGAPVFSSRVSDWQQSMIITGPFTGSNGTPPSLFYYDELNGGYISYPGVGGSNTALFDMGRGYSIFQFNGTTPFKLQIAGPLQQGDFDYLNLAPGADAGSNDGWNLLSNVYAAPIEWGNGGWQLNDISGTVWVRENFPGGVGAFKVWNGVTGDPDFQGRISQGQAFWVKASGSSPSLKITEDAKVNIANVSLFREGEAPNQLMITLKNASFKDRTFLHFSENSWDEIEGTLDALKQDNTYFNLSTVLNNTNLAINSMSLNFCEKSISLNIRNITAGHYSFDFSKLETFDFDVETKLVDHFTNASIALSEGTTYGFDVTADPLSAGVTRFELVMTKPAVDQSVSFASTLQNACETTGGVPVTLSTSQKGVLYSIMNNGNIIGSVQGNGSSVDAIIDASLLSYGDNTIQMRAGIIGCEAVPLSSQVVLSYKQVFEPIVNVESICEGGSALINASGSPAGTVYKWYETADAISPVGSSEQGNFSTPSLTKSKNYFVSSSYSGCEGNRVEIPVQVDHLDKPTIEVDGELLLSSSVEGNQWLLNGNVIPGATDVTYLPEEAGNYSTQVTSGACIKTSNEVVYTITASEQDPDLAINLYPNPVKSRLRVTLPDRFKSLDEVSISIYNSQGQLAGSYTKQVKSHSVEIDVQEFYSGLYTLLLEANTTSIQKRFIKE
ncbi:MAG: fibronectin type III domain-containing protein [Chryseolinea sp.]